MRPLASAAPPEPVPRDPALANLGVDPGRGERAARRLVPADLEPALAGRLILPALVEPHAHLDKALTCDVVGNERGDLDSAIAAWLAFRERSSTDEIRARARAVALRYVANGTTAIRTHADTGSGIGLRPVAALLDVRDELAEILDLQIVAAASNPIAGPAGRENRQLLRDALDAGADLVGGAPWLADDPIEALDVLLDIAVERGRGVDLHLDETTDPRVLTLPVLARRVADGFPHPATASHCVSLLAQPESVRRSVAEQVAAAGIGIVANPMTNLYLQGRGIANPTRGLTALRDLLDAGATVAGGGDNLRDPFNPMGRADPLETASLLVTSGHLTVGEALGAVTISARRVTGIGVPEDDGPAADLLAIAASSLTEAIAFATADRIVVRRGRVAVRTTVTTTLEPLAFPEVVS